VPTGAKGGFVIKNTPTDPKQLPVAVREAYSEYIRALLSIADTMRDGRVVRAQEVLAYEGDDPYFVVAADKGTATFSDVANQIAVKEFSFWLNDAFASGGSNGYDHKKYGITAKGAWECVVRHFRDLGMDFERVPFTAVGIGDMAGDVFGNGMLLSRKLKLLAAFNHKHIFLDPNPDPKKSFDERKRLFEDKNSGWDFYNKDLISEGGGVFDKNQKSIPISKELKTILGITENNLSGQALVTALLKAPVDLLYNGGIGTYVKSESEDNSKVGDPANNATGRRSR
jgi:glutamate dehydrogenase